MNGINATEITKNKEGDVKAKKSSPQIEETKRGDSKAIENNKSTMQVDNGKDAGSAPKDGQSRSQA